MANERIPGTSFTPETNTNLDVNPNGAASSTATEDDFSADVDILSIINEKLDPTPEAEEPEVEGEEPEVEETEEDEDGESHDPEEDEDAESESEEDADENGNQDEKEDKKGNFNDHPRFKELVLEKNQFKQQAEQYERGHKVWETISNVVENTVGPEVFEDILRAVSFSKDDPKKSLEVLTSFVSDLQIRAGTHIPADLADKVRAKEMSLEAAQEMTKLRVQARAQSTASQKAQIERQNALREQNDLALQAKAESMVTKMRTSDPHFAKKEPLILAMAVAMEQTHGQVETEEQLEERLNLAYKEVSKSFAPSPKRSAKPVLPGQGSTKPKPKPKHSYPATADGEVDIMAIINAKRQSG